MATEYPVRSLTKRCAATGRDIAAGDAFVSVLIDDGRRVTRSDYLAAEWGGPPEGTVGWWRGTVPRSGAATPAPREVLLGLLDEWADHPEEAPARYLLALLLVRRRILRVADEGMFAAVEPPPSPAEPAKLRLVSADRNEPIEVAVAVPSAAAAPRLQERLALLLGAA